MLVGQAVTKGAYCLVWVLEDVGCAIALLLVTLVPNVDEIPVLGEMTKTLLHPSPFHQLLVGNKVIACFSCRFSQPLDVLGRPLKI